MVNRRSATPSEADSASNRVPVSAFLGRPSAAYHFRMAAAGPGSGGATAGNLSYDRPEETAAPRQPAPGQAARAALLAAAAATAAAAVAGAGELLRRQFTTNRHS